MSGPYFANLLHTVGAGPGKLRLTKPLTFMDSRGRTWTVEEDFVTSLASYPKILPGLFRLFMPGRLENAKAAVLHDWAYANAGERVWYGARGVATVSLPILMTKDLADQLFREGMQAELPEGKKWKRWVPWLGVVVGGFLAWTGHYNRNAKE